MENRFPSRRSDHPPGAWCKDISWSWVYEPKTTLEKSAPSRWYIYIYTLYIDSSVSKGRGADRTARCYSISGSHSVRSFWLKLSLAWRGQRSPRETWRQDRSLPPHRFGMPGKWVGGKGSKACPEVGNVIEAMVYDDDGGQQGFVVIEVKRLSPPGEHGRFIQCDYITASDSFYRFWVESGAGSDTKRDGNYHLCKGNPTECTSRPRTGGQAVHLGKWRILKDEDLNPTVLTHYTGDAIGDLTRYAKLPETPPTAGEGGGGLPWPGGRSGGLKIGRDKVASKLKGAPEKAKEREKEKVREAEPSTAVLKKELEALKKRLAAKEAEEELERDKKRRRREKSPDDKEKTPRRGGHFKEAALGKVAGLPAPSSPPSDPSSDESSSNDSKGDDHDGDGGKKEKKPKRRKRSRSRKSSRDEKKGKKEGKERGGKKKKKRKKSVKKEKDRGPFGLSRTEEWSKCESSHSCGSTESSESKGGFRKASGGMDHHLRLVAYARKRPGRLAVRLLRKMGQAVGFSSGANLLQSPTTEGAVPASAHLYYLAVMTPQLANKWSPRSQRELKYWATVLDLLVQGKVAQVADVACQRVKALEKSIHDGNNWRRARFLELVEPEDLLLIDRGEERMMTKEVEHEDRHRPKGGWNVWERPPKGDPKGKGKGQKGDDRDHKGAGKKRTPAEQAAGGKDDKGKGS